MSQPELGENNKTDESNNKENEGLEYAREHWLDVLNVYANSCSTPERKKKMLKQGQKLMERSMKYGKITPNAIELERIYFSVEDKAYQFHKFNQGDDTFLKAIQMSAQNAV